MRERDIQAKVVGYARTHGVIARKLDFGEGWPDYLLLHTLGRSCSWSSRALVGVSALCKSTFIRSCESRASRSCWWTATMEGRVGGYEVQGCTARGPTLW